MLHDRCFVHFWMYSKKKQKCPGKYYVWHSKACNVVSIPTYTIEIINAVKITNAVKICNKCKVKIINAEEKRQ